MFRHLILAASALALSACAFPTTTLAQEEAAAASGPALWQVADEDTTVYLFGTIHVLPEGLDWFNPTIAGALASADQFVSEVDTSVIPEYDPASGTPPPPELMAIVQMQMQMAQLTTGGTLRDLMNAEDRAEYETAMAGLGVPAETFDGFEPWFAAMNMTQLYMMRAGLDMSDGVERVLDRHIEGKERGALETVEQQMGFFDGLPLDAQLAFLDEGVEGMAEEGAMQEMFDQMVSEWSQGRPDGLAAVMNEGMSDPVVYEALLARRNAAWAEWIDERMDRPGTVFIAVGAGHLAGAQSVQDYLAERGIATERVEY